MLKEESHNNGEKWNSQIQFEINYNDKRFECKRLFFHLI